MLSFYPASILEMGVYWLLVQTGAFRDWISDHETNSEKSNAIWPESQIGFSDPSGLSTISSTRQLGELEYRGMYLLSVVHAFVLPSGKAWDDRCGDRWYWLIFKLHASDSPKLIKWKVIRRDVWKMQGPFIIAFDIVIRFSLKNFWQSKIIMFMDFQKIKRIPE